MVLPPGMAAKASFKALVKLPGSAAMAWRPAFKFAAEEARSVTTENDTEAPAESNNLRATASTTLSTNAEEAGAPMEDATANANAICSCSPKADAGTPARSALEDTV
jgi:hypothetical protein